MTVLAELALHTHAQRARLFADGPEPKPRHVTAGAPVSTVTHRITSTRSSGGAVQYGAPITHGPS
jgi:hypothetical protein